MCRRTFICVSFAVTLHAAAFFALDRFWFIAVTPHPSATSFNVIELLPEVPEPIPIAEADPQPPPAPVAEPEKLPPLKSEPKIEPKPETKPELKSQPLVQTEPVSLAPKTATAVAPASTLAISSPATITATVDAAAVTKAVNTSTFPHDRRYIASVATQPVYLSNPKPDYPASARLKKQEGVVLLAVDVSTEGRPLRVEVETSSGFESLDESAVMKVRRSYRFKPARLDGVPVATRVQVPVRFQLKD